MNTTLYIHQVIRFEVVRSNKNISFVNQSVLSVGKDFKSNICSHAAVGQRLIRRLEQREQKEEEEEEEKSSTEPEDQP